MSEVDDEAKTTEDGAGARPVWWLVGCWCVCLMSLVKSGETMRSSSLMHFTTQPALATGGRLGRVFYAYSHSYYPLSSKIVYITTISRKDSSSKVRV